MQNPQRRSVPWLAVSPLPCSATPAALYLCTPADTTLAMLLELTSRAEPVAQTSAATQVAELSQQKVWLGLLLERREALWEGWECRSKV